MKFGTRTNRVESPSLNTTSRSLVLQNYFLDNPNLPEACKDNSVALSSMLSVYYEVSHKIWDNFLAVDLYKVCSYFIKV